MYSPRPNKPMDTNLLRNPLYGTINLKGIRIKESRTGTLMEIFSANGRVLGNRSRTTWIPFDETISGYFPGIQGEDVLTVTEFIANEKGIFHVSP